MYIYVPRTSRTTARRTRWRNARRATRELCSVRALSAPRHDSMAASIGAWACAAPAYMYWPPPRPASSTHVRAHAHRQPGSVGLRATFDGSAQGRGGLRERDRTCFRAECDPALIYEGRRELKRGRQESSWLYALGWTANFCNWIFSLSARLRLLWKRRSFWRRRGMLYIARNLGLCYRDKRAMMFAISERRNDITGLTKNYLNFSILLESVDRSIISKNDCF